MVRANSSSDFESDEQQKVFEFVRDRRELTSEIFAAYMEDYSRRNPRVPEFILRMRNSLGQNYYELAASHLNARFKEARSRILDIACGSGHALALVNQTHEIVGIDVSASEIARAKSLLAGRISDLRHASAENLPFADSSFDGVLCAMAIMLMRPVDLVLAEIARVLKSSGCFVSIVPSPEPIFDSHGLRFAKLNSEVARSFFPTYPDLGFGNSNFRSKDAIQTSFQRCFGQDCDIRIQDDIFLARVAIEEAVAFCSAMYWSDILPKSDRAVVKEEFRQHFLLAADTDGFVEVGRTFSIIECKVIS
jgi:ubiquinone/menaquinone biosynthesis C-methylase UbiE